MEISQDRSSTSRSPTPTQRSVRDDKPGTTSDPTPPGSWPGVHLDNTGHLSSSTSIHGTELASGTTAFSGGPPTQTQDKLQTQSDLGAQGQSLPREPEQRRRQYARAPHRGRYEPSHPNYRLTRGQLRDLASVTLEKLDLGFYVPPPFKTKADVEAEAMLKAEAEEQAKRVAGIAEKEEGGRDESITLDAQISSKGQDQDGSGGTANEAEQARRRGLDNEQQQLEEEEKEEQKTQEPPVYSSPYDLSTKIKYTEAHTEFYAPDDPYISNWLAMTRPDTTTNAVEGGSEHGGDIVKLISPPQTESSNEKTKTRILIREYSTLVGARKMHDLLRRKRRKDEDRVEDDDNDVSPTVPRDPVDISHQNDDKIGVLNFASAKKPGGGFINGSQAQEESLARTSTLYPSLITPTAAPFYEHYHANPDSPTAPYYTHAMVYSPSVVLFRNDKGLWMSPIEVDILTSAAVNAGEVRERVRWEEEMREVRERWEKAEEERRVWEEQEKKREEEEWETVLKENEEMKKRYGDEEKAPDEKDIGEKEGNPEETVESAKQYIKDETTPDASSGHSDTLSTSSIADQTSENSISATSSVAEKHQETETVPPASQDTITDEQDQAVTPEPAESSSEPKPDPMALAEVEIEAQMYERIARILSLFAAPSRPPSSFSSSPSPSSDTTTYAPRTPHLILGSFGTGVFQNNISLVARIFYDLLARRGAPFAGVFKTVVFAILGTGTVNIFKEVFAGHGDAAAAGTSTQAEDNDVLDEERNTVDEWVEIVKEGEDKDEIALDQEEEAGCEQEGVLEPVAVEAIPKNEHVDEVHEDGKGDDIVVDVDNINDISTLRGEEVEMLDGTHGDVDVVDVEMIYNAEDVHVHPQELSEET